MGRIRRTLCLVTLAALAAPETAAAEPETLRVLTFNAWGLWMISPSREARIEAMGPAIAALEPDVVAMQEVWVDADAARLQEDLRQAGLRHTRRFRSTWPGHSGLLIASRHPILDTVFEEYVSGTRPVIPWHVDWAGGKGVARVRIDTPAGPVDVADTHLHAGYGTDDYEMVQLAQIMQAAAFLDPSRRGEIPLIVAGDLNVRCASLPYRIFARRLGARPTDPDCGIDSISVRDGVAAELRVAEVREVLTTPVALSDGTTQRLSDHPGVLAVLEIGGPPAVAAPPPARWLTVVREALPRVHAARDAVSRAQLQNGVLGAVFLQAGLLAWWLRRRGWRRVPGRALASMGLASALWCGYLGLAYAPDNLHALDGVVQQLQAPLRAAMADVRDGPDTAATELADTGP